MTDQISMLEHLTAEPYFNLSIISLPATWGAIAEVRRYLGTVQMNMSNMCVPVKRRV